MSPRKTGADCAVWSIASANQQSAYLNVEEWLAKALRGGIFE